MPRATDAVPCLRMLSMRRASLCAVAVTAFGAPTRLFIRRTEAPQGRFFHLPGRLLWELDHPVDLVDLDGQDAFAQYLQEEGELLRIG